MIMLINVELKWTISKDAVEWVNCNGHRTLPGNRHVDGNCKVAGNRHVLELSRDV